MTRRYVGEITVQIDGDNINFTYPSDTNLPPKQEWVNKCIWSDNGKLIKPVNRTAELNLEQIVDVLKSNGFTKVKKDTSRKCTSLKYAVEAYTEKFNFLK